MRTLIIGSGGRESALAWKLAYPNVNVFVTPGNGCVPDTNRGDAKESDIPGIIHYARKVAADMVVVGPEAPLVEGIVETLGACGIRAFGPTSAAATLEGRKSFMKDICRARNIRTAPYELADQPDAALAAVRRMYDTFGQMPVIKADGLCAGKGVTLPESIEQAEKAIADALIDRIFGDAGRMLVIEQRLDGPECSMMFFCDGVHTIALPPARDSKRVGNGDTGPNTGGMGAFSPLPDVTDDDVEWVRQNMILPALREMVFRGHPFQGLLYAGLKKTAKGWMLLEFNARFGDPETQVVLPRIESNVLEYLHACTELGGLAKLPPRLRVSNDAAVAVVLASKGYPGKYKTGFPIFGIENAGLVFQAGTQMSQGQLVTSGGRILAVVGMGPTVLAARMAAYDNLAHISCDNTFSRIDIAAGV